MTHERARRRSAPDRLTDPQVAHNPVGRQHWVAGLQRAVGNRATAGLFSAAVPVVQRVPRRTGVEQGRYDFSTRCGWIDWDHASPHLAADLIGRVRQASDAFGTASRGEFSSPTMVSEFGTVLSSASVQVRLLRALSGEEVLQVALAIFKRLSVDFEAQQAWTDLVGQSSYAQEDLPSNLIGFYMAARGFTRPDLTQICGVVDRQASLAEFDHRHDFRQNHDFTPIGATEPWPAALSTIDSGRAAGLFEVTSVSVRRGMFAHRFAPLYRVEGTVGETDLVVLSWGGTTFATADDLQVVPTYQFRDETSGRYGHVRAIEVKPNREQDAALFRRRGLSSPMFMPEPVLVGLSSS
ncbi:hypothetical protein IU450_00365 [Nocardia abscessus]|uniref:hypothetical protein n=1 Tax=Nocardia abscessus TaxID=120957 RepID=UPI001895940C|nr:hypothetical protein [Nocardia abscessus]MBF6334332.1 hypothetical protein [Nocardia abscessus]